ncbi:hypothetical protein Ac2012v2_005363 [Leucoagaricus gongylophorus]
MTYQCLDCNRIFTSIGAIQSHSRAKGHGIPECGLCDRIFVDEHALDQHREAVHVFCTPCNRSFRTSAAYQQHLANSSAHQFDSDTKTVTNSSESDVSEAETYCYSCNRSFVSNSALNNHLSYSSAHNWCFVCSRDFASEQALAQHNASPAHKGKSYKCLFCDNMFKTPSSIAMHIESGCHRINRHQVTAAAHKLGIIPQISIPRRIEGLSKQPQLVNWFANENSFNGYSYECYLCHSTFKTLDRLNQHLNSPTHDESEFHCPHCGSEFQLISGLVQHIESESCGIARFQHVAKHFESLTQSFTRLLKL